MNRNRVMMVSIAACSIAFFACNTVMPEIIYHGLGFDK